MVLEQYEMLFSVELLRARVPMSSPSYCAYVSKNPPRYEAREGHGHGHTDSAVHETTTLLIPAPAHTIEMHLSQFPDPLTIRISQSRGCTRVGH
jgi:hypothetical protein